jgi:hypothetical protein
LQLALAPGAIAGILSIFFGWLWIGVVFHRYQKLTPNTSRPENNKTSTLSSLLSLLTWSAKVVNALTSSLLACGITAWWRGNVANCAARSSAATKGLLAGMPSDKPGA